MLPAEVSASKRAWALLELASRSPDDRRESVLAEALATARSISSPSERMWALAALTPRLPGDQREAVLGEALDAARSMASESALATPPIIAPAYERVWATLQLAPRLPAEQRQLVLAKGREAASQIASRSKNPWAFELLAPLFPAEQRKSVLAEALATARSIASPSKRAWRLVLLARQLPADQRKQVLADALAAASSASESERAWAFQRLAEELRPDLLAEALAAARSIASPSERVRVLKQLARLLPADQRESVSAETPDVAYIRPTPPASPPVRRYLLGRFPDTVRPGQVFSLLVSVVRSGGSPLKPFEVPIGGRLLALIIDAPGLRVLDDHRQTVLVRPGGDSEPVKFDLIGDNPGPQRIWVTAWDGGSYLGELAVEMSVELDSRARPDRTAISETREERTDGEVTLLVRYDPHQTAYRFEFIDVDYPDEVTSQLVYDPGPAVERLIRRLDALAEGTAGYSAAATRAYLVNEGVQLWQELVPVQLRSQFWERQRRITQLTILANRDVVPWELLYPKDRRRDAGFLVEQFPVTRAIYGHARHRRLRLRPARFVVPPGSPADAKAEARTLARLLGTRLTTVSELMPLLQLISKGRFGLLHFACHNRFDPDDGSSIKLDSPFTPTFLATAASDQTLSRAAPVVFINACRSLGQVPSYNKLDGWADKFLRAGAAAFIGSLWEVCDGTAREFAQELYRHLVAGEPLGKAVMAARRAVAAEPGDPTWLAYAVYGDPQARIDLTAS